MNEKIGWDKVKAASAEKFPEATSAAGVISVARFHHFQIGRAHGSRFTPAKNRLWLGLSSGCV